MYMLICISHVHFPPPPPPSPPLSSPLFSILSLFLSYLLCSILWRECGSSSGEISGSDGKPSCQKSRILLSTSVWDFPWTVRGTYCIPNWDNTMFCIYIYSYKSICPATWPYWHGKTLCSSLKFAHFICLFCLLRHTIVRCEITTDAFEIHQWRVQDRKVSCSSNYMYI